MPIVRLIILLCCFSVISLPAFAQGHSAFCGQVDSTAASQGCLKNHLDSAQKRLNEVYQNLSDELEAEKLQELQSLQATWLGYRDIECMWESERSATPSLKRINELSCMARVTEDRADLLTVVYAKSGDAAVQRELGTFPRWMNALAIDHPAVFWNYNKRPSYDLDCDKQNEFVMVGMQTKALSGAPIKKGEEKSTSLKKFSQDIVVAIAQNPQTGRPSNSVFKFPVTEIGGGKGLCSENVAVTFGMRDAPKAKEKGDAAAAPKICRAFLKIAPKGCAAQYISWTGKQFKLEPLDITN